MKRLVTKWPYWTPYLILTGFFIILATVWLAKNSQIQDLEFDNSKLRYEIRKSSVALNIRKSIVNRTASVFRDKNFSELHELLMAEFSDIPKEARLTVQDAVLVLYDDDFSSAGDLLSELTRITQRNQSAVKNASFPGAPNGYAELCDCHGN